jgi:hypothetical protein
MATVYFYLNKKEKKECFITVNSSLKSYKYKRYNTTPLEPICLLASPTTNATELAILKLRINGDIGIVRWFSNRDNTSWLSPLLSLPKTNQSPS